MPAIDPRGEGVLPGRPTDSNSALVKKHRCRVKISGSVHTIDYAVESLRKVERISLGMTGRYVCVWGFLLLLGVACAETEPGTPPPLDQLFYPTALAFAPGSIPSEDRLLVSNSNFDQRYNASTIMALSVEQLFELANQLSFDAPIETMPIVSAKKIPSLSGEIVLAASSSISPANKAFVTSRQGNFLTMLRLESGVLACDNAGQPLVLGFDCTAGHMVDTGGSDPFALSFVPGQTGQGFIATGHLRTTNRPREEIRPDIGIVTFTDVDLFEQRLLDEAAGQELSSPVLDVTVPTLTGVSGVSAAVATQDASGHELLIVDLNQTAGAVSVWEISQETSSLSVKANSKLSLGTLANSFSTRGLVTTSSADRAYVSLRFSESSGAYNAGIAVLARESSGSYALRNVYEFGSELGRPALLEKGNGERLLYVGDIRSDRIWILDVTSDAPLVVGELSGRAPAEIDGVAVRRRILDAPSHISFISRDGRTLGFVSNFSNSTLAVIDVTDPDPRNHSIIGRLGQVIEPDGTGEEDNE